MTDTRGERLPRLPADVPEDSDGGRGLLLVEALADRWGCSPRAEGRPRQDHVGGVRRARPDLIV
ncbi:hypothetical protein RKD40_001150 [Streptomyces ambofaciens]